jgi:quinol monooxygenase YgiN
MIISSNRYTVRPEYAAENAEHIREVMAELRAMNRTDITYRVFLQDDGKTFLHWRMCADEAASQVFDHLASFQRFTEALMASNPEVPPSKAVHFTVVDATSDQL